MREITDDSVQVTNYRDPSIEGTVLTFSCSSGLVLTGPNTSMCMDNGQWKPDLKEAKCKGEYT